MVRASRGDQMATMYTLATFARLSSQVAKLFTSVMTGCTEISPDMDPVNK